jgi:hypothetical protein
MTERKSAPFVHKALCYPLLGVDCTYQEDRRRVSYTLVHPPDAPHVQSRCNTTEYQGSTFTSDHPIDSKWENWLHLIQYYLFLYGVQGEQLPPLESSLLGVVPFHREDAPTLEPIPQCFVLPQPGRFYQLLHPICHQDAVPSLLSCSGSVQAVEWDNGFRARFYLVSNEEEDYIVIARRTMTCFVLYVLPSADQMQQILSCVFALVQ